MKVFRLKRDISIQECPWLDDKDYHLKDDIVYEYLDHTYGCISSQGIAVSNERNKRPFFELPIEALEKIK